MLHFVIKDDSYNTSIFFYALPLPIIIVIILTLSIFLSRRKYNIVLAGLLLVIWLGRSLRMNMADDIKETDLEIVFWNASRHNNFEEAFNENNGVPDIFVLAEGKEDSLNKPQSKYPNYYFHKAGVDLLVFSKTPLKIIKEDTSRYHSTIVNFKTGDINYYAVDVSGSTDVPRQWELGFINSLIKETEKTIVLGDFNVPYESVLLKNIKKNFNHAFSKKGNGFRETWYWNWPLLSLDHIWVSRDLEILKTEKINTSKSDHSMIKTYIKN